MTASAHDVAAVLRERLPGVGVKKLHKLLYYCQGHHLAQFEEPLFGETISAWDMGPVVGRLWHREREGEDIGEPAALDEAALNTVGYVLSRYGNLTGKDLENLTHSEPPWRISDQQRGPHERVTIKQDLIKLYFQTSGAPGDEEDEEPLDTSVVRDWLSETTRGNKGPNKPDDIGAIRARLRRSA